MIHTVAPHFQSSTKASCGPEACVNPALMCDARYYRLRQTGRQDRADCHGDSGISRTVTIQFRREVAGVRAPIAFERATLALSPTQELHPGRRSMNEALRTGFTKIAAHESVNRGDLRPTSPTLDARR
jgi:hypothetical protein